MFTPHHHQFRLAQDLVMIHLNGVLIASLQRPSTRVNICHWQGYFVEIYCRTEQSVWHPYRVEYHPVSAAYIHQMTSQLNPQQCQLLWQALKVLSIAQLN